MIFYNRQQQREASTEPPINTSECVLRVFDSARKVLARERAQGHGGRRAPTDVWMYTSWAFGDEALA